MLLDWVYCQGKEALKKALCTWAKWDHSEQPITETYSLRFVELKNIYIHKMELFQRFSITWSEGNEKVQKSDFLHLVLQLCSQKYRRMSKDLDFISGV
jgi:hypothetical protein